MDPRPPAQLGLPAMGEGPDVAGDEDRFPIGAGRGLIGLAVAALATLFATLVVAVAFAAAGAGDIDNNKAFLLLATLAQDIAFVATAYLLTAEGGPVSPATFGFRPVSIRLALKTMGIAFVAYYALSLVYNALFGPPCERLPDDLGVHDSVLLAVLAGIFVIGIAPFAEELFFRGFLFQSLRASWGVWIAAPASGLIFGVVHFEPDKLVPLAILGTALAWVFHRTRSIWPCIAIHGINNTLAFIVLLSDAGGC
jgi:membrane protease YdiL (CAAX protease family)